MISSHDSHLNSAPDSRTSQLSTQLDRKSQFGQFIAPLYDQLKEIPLEAKTLPEQSLSWLTSAFSKIVSHYQTAQTINLELSDQDQLFMMGDPIGDILRRVHLHQWTAEKLQATISSLAKEPALTAEESSFLLDAVNITKRCGYSKFFQGAKLTEAICKLESGTEMYIDRSTFIRMNSPLAGFVYPRLKTFLDEFKKECLSKCVAIEVKWQELGGFNTFLTDTGHMWKGMYLALRFLSDPSARQIYTERLDKPVHLMVVEDNPLHQLFFEPLNHISNLTRYQGAIQSTDLALQEQLAAGYFPNAEHALLSLHQTLKIKGKLPTVVVSDIELIAPGLGMNGIEFLRTAHNLLEEHGRREEIMFAVVYSSNLSLYQSQVDELVTDGVINRAWNKAEFSLAEFTSNLNMAT